VAFVILGGEGAMVDPAQGYSSAGNPIHHGFSEGLVSVVPLNVGKVGDYRMEYVLFVLNLHSVRET